MEQQDAGVEAGVWKVEGLDSPGRALPPRWPPPLLFFDRLAPKANEASKVFLPLFFAIATTLTLRPDPA